MGDEVATSVFDEMWRNRLEKRGVKGIHGTLLFELLSKKSYYPTKRKSEMVVVLQGNYCGG
ncbi:hypothetical protein QE400_000549 [Xanthomonas sacchari]|uniref:hypothetical protein n=1 Tax=Xanthomonas sacchari TaxID=56458 RepID=UPI00277F03BD|nr:hypothetical protein [Xanthomonas sacchari]MDQ1091136.1 hypothetical protein [Xanthomonas sacchari]